MIGRLHKNYERKRQASKKQQVGCPLKNKAEHCSVEIIVSITPSNSECDTIPSSSECITISSANEYVTIPSYMTSLSHDHILPQSDEFTSESWITNFTPPHINLPQKWNYFSNSNNTELHVYKIEDMNAYGNMNPSQHSFTVSHSIAINKNLMWSLHVHGQQVDSTLCTSLTEILTRAGLCNSCKLYRPTLRKLCNCLKHRTPINSSSHTNNRSACLFT